MPFKNLFLVLLPLLMLAACDFINLDDVIDDGDGGTETRFAGAVYVMTNETTGNRIVAYGRGDDGTLTLLDDFATGGVGAAFDGGEGLDPLISAYSLVKTEDNRHVLAVNPGSNTITAFRINSDFTLTRTDEAATNGVGPNSIAYRDGIVYVANIDEDGAFGGEPDQEGNLTGFTLSRDGRLTPIAFSNRSLGGRPSAIQFSPDGDFLVVAVLNAGSAALASGTTDELVVYSVNRSGALSTEAVGAGSSTQPNNAEGRNLPTPIGFEVVEASGANYVVVTEAREFQPDGTPPTFPNLQTGSVSTFRIERDGSLTGVSLDVLAGNSFTDGQRTACWIEFSADQRYFWVSNALESTLSAYSFSQGTINLVDDVAAAGTPPGSTTPSEAFANTDGWVDLWISDDGRYLYQLFGLDGTVGVFEVNGSSLRLIEEVTGDLPEANTQGIVAL